MHIFYDKIFLYDCQSGPGLFFVKMIFHPWLRDGDMVVFMINFTKIPNDLLKKLTPFNIGINFW